MHTTLISVIQDHLVNLRFLVSFPRESGSFKIAGVGISKRNWGNPLL